MRIAAVAALCSAIVFAQEPVDLGVVDRIKTEAFGHSKVMDHLYYLTEAYGPRLTGSPEFDQAANWAASRLKEFGLENVHFEKWGPFGRSWSLKQSSLELIEPRYQQLTAVPLAWSAPTNGPVSAELVLAPFNASFVSGPKKFKEDFEAYKTKWSGKLRGKIVLLNDVRVPAQQTNPKFRRYTAEDLARIGQAPEPAARPEAKKLEDLDWPEDQSGVAKLFEALPPSLMDQFMDLYMSSQEDLGSFFSKEGVAGLIRSDGRAHEGLLFAEFAGNRRASAPLAPATFVVTAEQYDRIV